MNKGFEGRGQMSHTSVRKILFLAAGPSDQAQLRLGEECSQIGEGLLRSKCRDRFEFIQQWAVTPEKLHRALVDHQPDIVHFSGHGSGETGLVLENGSGRSQLIPTDHLNKLFKLRVVGTIKCVVLNACYSEAQARVIRGLIPDVVGMNKSIADEDAIRFAVHFYGALAASSQNTYQDAFESACLAIEISGSKGWDTPARKHLRRLGGATSKRSAVRTIVKAAGIALMLSSLTLCADAMRTARGEEEAIVAPNPPSPTKEHNVPGPDTDKVTGKSEGKPGSSVQGGGVPGRVDPRRTRENFYKGPAAPIPQTNHTTEVKAGFMGRAEGGAG